MTIYQIRRQVSIINQNKGEYSNGMFNEHLRNDRDYEKSRLISVKDE